MAYYRNYRSFRSRYTKSASVKTNKEKIINLKLEEFQSLELKYQTFSYDKLLLEEKRLEEKISKNSSFVQESDLYIQNILKSSLDNKKKLFHNETERIRSDLIKKFNVKEKYEEHINEIELVLEKIRKEKREEYERSQIIPKIGYTIAKIAATVVLIPLAGAIWEKRENTPYLPKTDEESKLEKKLSNILENKKKVLDLIEKELEEVIRTTKNLNDLKNEILRIEEEIKTLNYKIDLCNVETPKIREALKLIFPNIKKRTKERERSAKIAAFDDKARTGSQTVKVDLLKSIKNKSKWKCPYCDLNNSIDGAVADHIYPVNKGGLSTPENMVLICEDCNKKKSNLVLRVFCKKNNFDFDIVCGRLEKQGKYI